MYKAGVCSRLSWLLTIEGLPISLVWEHLDAIATKCVKQWAGLAKSANTAILYLPRKIGGLNLPLFSLLHKCLQVSRQSQLLKSPDLCVQHMAQRNLQMISSLKDGSLEPA